MEPYSGNHKVLVVNGNVLPISHIGSRHLNTSSRYFGCSWFAEEPHLY